MRKISKVLGMLAAAFMVAVLAFSLADTSSVSAAAKKTVRVTNQKSLNKALKNSKVGTIILRSDSINPITISSKKAKKKDIVIDVPNATVVNKAKFKSITIESADKYIEDVSGNTIYTYETFENQDPQFEVAAKKSVKKLVLYNLPVASEMYYIVHDGASIKEIAIDNNGNKSTFDKKTRTLKIDTYDFTDPDTAITYTFKLDKSGRIENFSVTGAYWDDTFEYSYGDVLKITRTNGNPNSTRCNYTATGEYDKKSNRLKKWTCIEADDTSTEYTFEYYEDGNLAGWYSIHGLSGSDIEYRYDDKGRLASEICTLLVRDDLSDEFEILGINSQTYEYDKNNCVIKEIYHYLDGGENVYTYEYDKAGNMVFFTWSDGTEVEETKNEYNELGGLINSYHRDENGNWEPDAAG